MLGGYLQIFSCCKFPTVCTCQKLWKLVGSRQSYCNNKRVPFYGSHCSLWIIQGNRAHITVAILNYLNRSQFSRQQLPEVEHSSVHSTLHTNWNWKQRHWRQVITASTETGPPATLHTTPCDKTDKHNRTLMTHWARCCCGSDRGDIRCCWNIFRRGRK